MGAVPPAVLPVTLHPVAMISEKTAAAAPSEDKDSAAKNDDEVVGPPIQSFQLGVYRVVTEILPPFSPREQWKKAKRVVPTLSRLIKDVYADLPWTFFGFLLAQIWSSCIDQTLSLHLSSRILTTVRGVDVISCSDLTVHVFFSDRNRIKERQTRRARHLSRCWPPHVMPRVHGRGRLVAVRKT
jgi:hypothetical protein